MSQMWTHTHTHRQTEKDVNPTSRYSTGFSICLGQRDYFIIQCVHRLFFEQLCSSSSLDLFNSNMKNVKGVAEPDMS